MCHRGLPTSCGAACPPATCARASTAISTSNGCGACGGRSARSRTSSTSARRRTLLVYAKYDLTFPVDLSRMLVDEFQRRALPHEVAVLPCGHYSTGAAPFKFLDGYVLTRFLMKNL